MKTGNSRRFTMRNVIMVLFVYPSNDLFFQQNFVMYVAIYLQTKVICHNFISPGNTYINVAYWPTFSGMRTNKEPKYFPNPDPQLKFTPERLESNTFVLKIESIPVGFKPANQVSRDEHVTSRQHTCSYPINCALDRKMMMS